MDSGMVDAENSRLLWLGRQSGSAGYSLMDPRQRLWAGGCLADKLTAGSLDQADQMGHQESGQAQRHRCEHPDAGVRGTDNNLFYHLRSHLRDHSSQTMYRAMVSIALAFFTVLEVFTFSSGSFRIWDRKVETADHGHIVSGSVPIFPAKFLAFLAWIGGSA